MSLLPLVHVNPETGAAKTTNGDKYFLESGKVHRKTGGKSGAKSRLHVPSAAPNLAAAHANTRIAESKESRITSFNANRVEGEDKRDIFDFVSFLPLPNPLPINWAAATVKAVRTCTRKGV